MPSLLDKLHSLPFAFIDVETTGASADYGDRVIEIGIVRVERGPAGAVTEYQQLIDPQRHIGAGIVALTGITQEMVTDQPCFPDVLPRVIELMQGAIVVGHNVRFDLSFFATEFRRCRQAMHECLNCKHVLDTVRIARRRFGRGGNGLQKLAPRLGVAPTGAHRALADALTTYQIFDRLLAPVGGWDICLCDAIAQQGGPMSLLPTHPKENPLPLELLEALEQCCPVLMEYIDGVDQLTRRTIQPLRLRRRKGELTLIAHCHLRNDQRTFKLDRIVSLTKLEEAQPPAPAFDDSQTLFTAE